MSSRRSLSAMRLGELGTWLGSNLAPSAVRENSKAWAANYSKTHMEGGTVSLLFFLLFFDGPHEVLERGLVASGMMR